MPLKGAAVKGNTGAVLDAVHKVLVKVSQRNQRIKANAVLKEISIFTFMF
jgi:hypothetical protein